MKFDYYVLKTFPILFFIVITPVMVAGREEDTPERPNILWLTIEDTSADEFSCYGQSVACTPSIDQLAEKGIRFTQAWSTGPQCSPAHSTLMTGSYATTYGMDIHRRNYKTPDNIFFPQFLRQADYFCTNNSKTDYNTTEYNKTFWDECSNSASYNSSKRKPNQPFFSVFNYDISLMSLVRSIHLEGRRHSAAEGLNPDKLIVPPHIPDLPEMHSDLAYHLEGVQDVDQWVGIFLDDLEKRGLAENTIFFFYSDHGGCLPRGKGFLYRSGLHVPLIIYVPPKWQYVLEINSGSISDRLVGSVDFAPTILSIAGIKPPQYMQGKAFLGPFAKKPRIYQFGLRGNQSYHYDPWRNVTDGRFSYIRTYQPAIPAYIRHFFQWGMPGNLAWDNIILTDSVNVPEKKWRIPFRLQAVEQLFDLQNDSCQINNLTNDPAQAAKLTELRSKLENHLPQTKELEFFPPDMRDKGISLYDWVCKTNFTIDELIAFTEQAGLGDITPVPAKITRSGHQMELKLYEHHFYKADWEELDKLIEAA